MCDTLEGASATAGVCDKDWFCDGDWDCADARRKSADDPRVRRDWGCRTRCAYRYDLCVRVCKLVSGLKAFDGERCKRSDRKDWALEAVRSSEVVDSLDDWARGREDEGEEMGSGSKVDSG